MNAGTIVGYVTRPNGSPVSGAEIWIAQTDEFNFSETEVKPVAKTDVRGYFQLTLTVCGADISAVGGKLNISVGAQKDDRMNSKADIASNNGLQVTGYLIKGAAASNA